MMVVAKNMVKGKVPKATISALRRSLTHWGRFKGSGWGVVVVVEVWAKRDGEVSIWRLTRISKKNDRGLLIFS
jgi:hypothetical protein